MAALVIATASVGGIVTAPPIGAATSVVVSPATGVSGGQLVTIQGEGFEPGELAGWCQAVDVPPGGTSEFCGANTTYTRVVGADGSFSGQVRLERFMFVPFLDRWVDCADPAENCGIGAAAANDVAGTATFAPLAFGPVPAPPTSRGTVVVAPSSQVAGGTVTVTGSGFRPNALVYVMQCAPGATDQTNCGYPKVYWIPTDANGDYEVTTTIGATVDPVDGFGAPPTSCITTDPARRCSVAVAEAVDVPGTFVSTPVDVVPGAVTVTPSTGVVAGPTMATVTGAAFPPGAEVGICLGVAPSGPLRWWPLASTDVSESRMGFCGTALDFDQSFELAPVGADGTFSRSGFRIERYVYVYGPDRVVDCADQTETCFVHVFATADVQETLTSVSLAVAAPPPPPATRGAITAQPSSGLEGNDLVAVNGSGFRPGSLVDLYRCEAGATDRGQCERLQTSAGNPASVLADDTGTLPTTQLRLPAETSFFRFSFPDPYDCDVDACSITAAESVDFAGTATEAPIVYGFPTVVPGAVTVVEGDSGTVVANVPVALSASSTEAVTVEWATLDYTATAPGDYQSASGGSVTFAPGQTDATVPVTINADQLHESDEVALVSFTNPTNATIGGFYGLGFAIIEDDDPEPTAIPGLGLIREGDAGTVVLEVPITLTAPSGLPVTVDWRTHDLTATAPTDYLSATGAVTVEPGDTRATASITVNGDHDREHLEALLVSFRNPTGARLGGFYGLGLGLILDDD